MPGCTTTNSASPASRSRWAVAETSEPQAGRWVDGVLPANVTIGPETVITGPLAFKRFRSRRDLGLTVGGWCTLDGAHFAIGEDGWMVIGDYCYVTNAVLLCELEVVIGSYVVIGW